MGAQTAVQFTLSVTGTTWTHPACFVSRYASVAASLAFATDFATAFCERDFLKAEIVYRLQLSAVGDYMIRFGDRA